MPRWLSVSAALVLAVLLSAAGPQVNSFWFEVANVAFTDSDSTDTNADSYTFSNLDVGAATGDRLIVAICVHRTGATQLIDTITVDGNAATIPAAAQITDGATNSVSLGYIVDSSGTTAEVVCGASNTTGAPGGGAVMVYTLKNYDSATPVDADELAVTGTTNCALTLESALAKGAAIAAHANGATNSTTTWTGVTEDVDGTYPGGDAGGFSAGSASTTGSITATAAEQNSSTRVCIAAAWK